MQIRDSVNRIAGLAVGAFTGKGATIDWGAAAEAAPLQYTWKASGPFPTLTRSLCVDSFLPIRVSFDPITHLDRFDYISAKKSTFLWMIGCMNVNVT